ncbi:MAG: molecular chaperone GrpE [Alphaproteobacteria bacterium]|jgi:molecular chaperone GrpE|nr:molecular chaperone GrpE [Alphaproteobacteria bacterium]
MTDQSARRPEDAATEPDQAEGPAPSEQAKIAELVETLARESAENKDKLLRALAEMENLRRRTDRQVVDARDYAITAFARDVLAVSDNMHRAIESIGPELKSTADGPVKALLDGVELTERELLKALEKHGVRKFEPAGERFDPNVHQAMYELPDPSVPAGTIAQVVQAGYMIGDRVLRPALVAVAKGGPRMPPPGEPGAAAETPANDNAGDPPDEPQGQA